jgi:hypothetical protein
MKNFGNAIHSLTAKGQYKVSEIKERITGIFAQERAEGFVDTALKILISVVVGALLLAGLYMLFQDTILPTLTDRIKELFNYHS